MSTASRIFVPYRALGFVTTPVPFVMQHRGGESFITTSVGKSWHTYNCGRLNLLFVGQRQSKKIKTLAVKGDYVFTGCGKDIIVYKRGRTVTTLSSHIGRITHLLVFGDHLLSCGEDHRLTVTSIETWEEVRTIQLPNEFRVSAIMHPPTYLNKILLGGEDGTMQLWNIRTGNLVYEFETCGSPITCLAPSPALDIVALGTLDGHIIVHNLKFDEKIVEFEQSGTVTTLSFRTDGSPLLASGTNAGHVTLWDLEKRVLAGTMITAHEGAVVHGSFLPEEPVFVTIGADNAIKMWLFDASDPASARLLRHRCGHSSPPSLARFYGDQNMILSSGRDRSLRFFSTIQDAQNRELSQGQGKQGRAAKHGIKSEDLKLPMITQISACPLREKDWDNILTCHADSSDCRTWSASRSAIGKHVLASRTGSVVTCVYISACGNYGLCGNNAGNIEMFNMQSGRYRHCFDYPYSESKDGVQGTVVQGTIQDYERCVTAIAADGLNKFVVSGSMDGYVRVWEFGSGKLIDTIGVGSAISTLVLHGENGLFAVVSDDLILRVYDLDSRRLVRTYAGHSNRITDVTFSPDGRWLCTSSLDCTVRICDIPTSHCIDWFRVDRPCTSISFSPNGGMLATTHVDALGINLWVNRSQYERVSLIPITTPPLSDAVIEAPIAMECEPIRLDDASPVPGMATLSGVTDSRWATVSMMDEIRARNKPKEAPQAPERAPFFLTASSTHAAIKAPVTDHIADFGKLTPQSELSLLLSKCAAQVDEMMVFMRESTPASADLAYATINDGDDSQDLINLVTFFEDTLMDPSEFELKNAHLHLFLKRYGLSLANSTRSELKDAVLRLGDAQRAVWRRLEMQFNNTLCLTSYLAQ